MGCLLPCVAKPLLHPGDWGQAFHYHAPMAGPYQRVGTIKSAEAFRAHLAESCIDLPVDKAILASPESPLARPIACGDLTIGNRFAIHPMEGWDGTSDGKPSPLTVRRWQRFGLSGAKLIWGGEAMAVSHDGRANPEQLLINNENAAAIGGLRTTLIDAHREHVGPDNDLVIGLQLTHSGRFARPNRKDRLEPRIAYSHPVLDRRFHVDATSSMLHDDDLHRIIEQFVDAAVLAEQLGFDFVDVKHCHGYLGHELLSGHNRDGAFGGSFENRTRFLRMIVAGVRDRAPRLAIGVRLSAFDMPPFKPDPNRTDGRRLGPGIVDVEGASTPYTWGFGLDTSDPVAIDLTETRRFLSLLQTLDIRLVNLTAGSPYYNPHIQRPALYPPSDGYQPPEDPLVGVARQINATAELKRDFPDLVIVGTAYSYLQEYLPHVAQAVIRDGGVDLVGLGRMVLSYPELPHDVLTTGTLKTKLLCRTFSDCTTAPRNGLVSGCYPLDPYYKKSDEMKQLKVVKKA